MLNEASVLIGALVLVGSSVLIDVVDTLPVYSYTHNYDKQKKNNEKKYIFALLNHFKGLLSN